MNEQEAMAEDPSAVSAEAADAVGAADSVPAQPEASAQAEASEYPEPVETRSTVEVGLVRSVRFGPIMIGGAIIGALVCAVIALGFPVIEGADYTMGQVIGFVAVLGAVLGLTLGAVLSLILVRVARRKRGAAIAVLTDVR